MKLKRYFHSNTNLAAIALKWILMFPEVSCIIPGASRPDQVISNLNAAELPDLDSKQMDEVAGIYKKLIWPDVSKEKW